jgi:hypothetical protein
MNQSHADNIMPPARATALVTGLAALVITGLSGVALAERNSAPASPPSAAPAVDSQGRAQAPIGHRQPRPQDLPPSVLREEEGGRTRAQEEFDKSLQICKGC